MPYFDRFDIAEAYYDYAVSYNVGGYATGRQERFRGETHSDIWSRLSRMGFKQHDYGSLTENGQEIYDALVERKEAEESTGEYPNIYKRKNK